jgi:RNA polymerase sigma-70 factor (ECF subfamily)
MAEREEKRRHPRVALQHVLVEVCSGGAESDPRDCCPVIDLSEGGMRFAARESLEPGRPLRLTFTLPGTSSPIRTDATVIHTRVGSEQFGVDVRFRDLALAAQRIIAEYVARREGRFDGPDGANGRGTPGGGAVPDPAVDNNLKPEAGKGDNIYVTGNAEGGTRHDEAQLLIQQCLRNDRRAQEQLFKKYRNTVYGLVCRLLGADFDIDDVLQQVFVNVFRSLESFKGLSSFDTWVYRIAVKVCTDQLRKKYRKRKLSVAGSVDDERAGLEATTDNTPHTTLERRELVGRINAALGRLTVEKRLVVVMYEMEGKSLEEIAGAIEKPLGTVKSRLFHARRELGKHLKKYLGAEE